MRTCPTKILSGIEIVFFEDAAEMIVWLGQHLGEVVLISLDHDLPIRNESGKSIDCGAGREVVDYLAALPPTCPVIVHSSNNDCAQGMFFALQDAGWPCRRVYPCDGEAWIAGAWAAEVRRLISDGWIANRSK